MKSVVLSLGVALSALIASAGESEKKVECDNLPLVSLRSVMDMDHKTIRLADIDPELLSKERNALVELALSSAPAEKHDLFREYYDTMVPDPLVFPQFYQVRDVRTCEYPE